MKYARIFGDGDLLIRCNNEGQMEKSKKISFIGKIKVIRVGERKACGSKGLICGILLTVNMKVENMRLQNSSVNSAVRMTRGTEKTRNRICFG